MLLHTQHRPPQHSRRPRPWPGRCGHSACAAVAHENAAAERGNAAQRAGGARRGTRRRSAALAVVLVSVVGGRAVALLTRADGEAEYTFTAGCRWLEEPEESEEPGKPPACSRRSETQWQREGGCYMRAAARILEKDANIDAKLVQERVHFFATPRLPSGTPGMFVAPSALCVSSLVVAFASQLCSHVCVFVCLHADRQLFLFLPTP